MGSVRKKPVSGKMDQIDKIVKDHPPKYGLKSGKEPEADDSHKREELKGVKNFKGEEFYLTPSFENLFMKTKHGAEAQGLESNTKEKMKVVVHINQDIRGPKEQASRGSQPRKEEDTHQTSQQDMIA